MKKVKCIIISTILATILVLSTGGSSQAAMGGRNCDPWVREAITVSWTSGSLPTRPTQVGYSGSHLVRHAHWSWNVWTGSKWLDGGQVDFYDNKYAQVHNWGVSMYAYNHSSFVGVDLWDTSGGHCLTRLTA